jgi:hypothetical protein
MIAPGFSDFAKIKECLRKTACSGKFDSTVRKSQIKGHIQGIKMNVLLVGNSATGIGGAGGDGTEYSSTDGNQGANSSSGIHNPGYRR